MGVKFYSQKIIIKGLDMNRLKMFLVATLLSSFAFASDKTPSISEVMAKMENGLNQIQKGFLYNNIELIKSGVDEIEKENMIYHDQKNILPMLPKNKLQMKNAAILTSNRIDNSAKEIKEYIKHKKIRNAYDAYSSMLNACTDCHTIVRGW